MGGFLGIYQGGTHLWGDSLGSTRGDPLYFYDIRRSAYGSIKGIGAGRSLEIF